MNTYLVGGAVRDALLGRPVRERDWVVVGSTPEAMTEQGYKPVGKDFPVFLHPDTGEEYALARTERKSGRGYHGFVFHTGPEVTLDDDLQRRDFTVNAIAQDADGNLSDPHGGQADIAARVLRHVSEAFAEDPVRVLRGARFVAELAPWNFTVADDTVALMRQMVEAGEVDALQPERVWQETRRALMSDAPQKFFELLRACGALARIFPEVDALFGKPQPEKYHPEIDTGVHLMMVLEQAANMGLDEITRYAALCHDLGKGVTPEHILPSHRGHEAAGVPIVKAMSERLRVPKAYRELAEVVAREHLHGHRAFELKPTTVQSLFERLDAYRRPERVKQFCDACEADSRGRLGLEDEPYPQADYLQRCFAAARAVSPKAIVERGVQGPAVGVELAKARVEAVAAIAA